MRRIYLTVLIAAILVFSGCAQLTSEELAPEITPPAEEPTPPPTVTPTPTAEEILASHFGIVDALRQDIDESTRLGIRWDRPHPGPFIWGWIEPEKGNFSWGEVDEYVQEAQSYNIATLATIWPFAEWDQADWGPAGTGTLIFENELGTGRRKPHDMDAYRSFVLAIVERYDGDGKDDMPGLEYPIKYWEASNEPSEQIGELTFFNGSSEDYLEVLKVTYEAVKEADPEARVLHAGMSGMEPYAISFWQPVFDQGSSYFDINNIHSIGASDELNVPEFKKLLSTYGIDKPIWVTEAEHPIGENRLTGRYVSLEEQGRLMVKSYAIAFASGVDKVFYTMFKVPSFAPSSHRQAALFDESGEKRPAYYALETLVSKLGKFTSAEELAEGQYRFMIEGKTVYVLWGSGELPEEITGEVLITDIYGEETRTNSSAINLTESPIFVTE